jgi:transposase
LSLKFKPSARRIRSETPISEISRREGIAASLYYKRSKSFLEAGKNGLTKAILRDATGDQVRGLKQENSDLKKAVAELVLEVQRYRKKSRHVKGEGIKE